MILFLKERDLRLRLWVEAARHLLRNPIHFQIWAPIKEYIAIIWRQQHLFSELHPSVESKQT